MGLKQRRLGLVDPVARGAERIVATLASLQLCLSHFLASWILRACDLHAAALRLRRVLSALYVPVCSARTCPTNGLCPSSDNLCCRMFVHAEEGI